MQMDQDKLKAENHNVMNHLRDKTQKHKQVQELYDRMKRREMAAGIQHAAYDSADDVLQNATLSQAEQHRYTKSPTFATYAAPNAARQVHENGDESTHPQNGMQPPPRRAAHNAGNHGIRLSESAVIVIGRSLPFPDPEATATPQHRTRLGSANHIPASAFRNGGGPFSHPMSSQHPSGRRPLGSTSGNVMSRPGVNNSFGVGPVLRKGTPQGSRLATYETSFSPTYG